MPATRRAVLTAGPLLAAAPLGCPALAQSRQPLTVMAYGGVYERILRETVIPRFEAEHPYAVTLVAADDTLLLPRMMSARGRAPYDVITLNDDAATLLRARGLLAPDQSAALPGLADTYDSMKPPRTVIYGVTVYQYDLVYRGECQRGCRTFLVTTCAYPSAISADPWLSGPGCRARD
jgi:putative spermidine/putrescine transport system substrate-binding protein